MKKEKNISQTFCSMQNVLELQCLVDGLVDFLKFIIDTSIGDLGMEKTFC